jgi:hypothetical protein
MTTHHPTSRRQFIQSTAAASAALTFGTAPAFVRALDQQKVRIAVIAVGGRGASNLKGVGQTEEVVALCDVNTENLDRAAGQYPKAAKFTDFRRVFDHAKDFDAVVISTCEHTHGMATILALEHDKHVFCEKPLTHNIWEARQVRLAAAAKPKLKTIMGIQMHASNNYREVVEVIRTGVLGRIKEVHVWVNRAWGLQSKEAAERNKDRVYVAERPSAAQQPPKDLDWDLWLGPAPQRPFNEVYFPGPKWYRWWEWGNGTMSDLGSHWNDLPFWALNLDYPRSIEPFGPPAHPDIAPASYKCKYTYGERDGRPGLDYWWYQGEEKPEIWKAKGIPQNTDGHLFIGEKGMLLSNYKNWVLLPEKDFAGFKAPPQTLPRVTSHHAEWLAAIRGDTKTSAAIANFEYAGWVTEANHLGNVAYRVGKKIEWDPKTLSCPNAPEAAKFIKREYRKGWEWPVTARA